MILHDKNENIVAFENPVSWGYPILVQCAVQFADFPAEPQTVLQTDSPGPEPGNPAMNLCIISGWYEK